MIYFWFYIDIYNNYTKLFYFTPEMFLCHIGLKT